MEPSSTSNKNKRSLSEVEPDELPDLSWIRDLSISEIKDELKKRQVAFHDVVEKGELIRRLEEKLLQDVEKGIPIKKPKTKARRDCPYLDTINRNLLDFDFEKLCSVTLQNLNVYACLVCGKFFQGRGRNSQAYVHSLQANHHVFINLHNEKVYCLPDDYEVIDSSLADIKSVLNPKFSVEDVKNIDNKKKVSYSLDGTEYIPGYVGLNNIKHTDYINVVIQALVHVVPLRDFFLIPSNYESKTRDSLTHRFGELTRKIYNPNNFKSQVDPHELLQAITTASNKKFRIGVLKDPIEFISFLLNHLHKTLGGNKSPDSSIIYQTFRGEVEMTVIPKEGDPVTKQMPFLHLTLDLPPPPLFQDEQEKNIIPQIPIFNILSKFDGVTPTHMPNGETKKFRLLKLPRYLIMHIRRFTKNNWFKEKNPTIVNFPLKNLDLKDYVAGSVKGSTKYNLVANICHDGEPDKGTYRAHILNKPFQKWHEMQDLSVTTIMPQLIALSESYIQVFERQDE